MSPLPGAIHRRSPTLPILKCKVDEFCVSISPPFRQVLHEPSLNELPEIAVKDFLDFNFDEPGAVNAITQVGLVDGALDRVKRFLVNTLQNLLELAKGFENRR